MDFQMGTPAILSGAVFIHYPYIPYYGKIRPLAGIIYGIWFLLQFAGFAAAADAIAYTAHIGGFFVGVILVLLFKK